MTVITTVLEMRSRPSLSVLRPHRAGMLLRLEPPTIGFYRYLYRAIGEPWGWTNRDDLSDDELLIEIDHEAVDVFVFSMGGVPAGMFELDRRDEPDIQLRHFGLMAEFMGRGLAKPLLASAVESAWDHGPDRVWVSSSSLEHPQGLLLYQWAGFAPISSTTE